MYMMIKSFSRRCLAWILFFMLLLTVLCHLAGFWLWRMATRALPPSVLEHAAIQSDAFEAGLEKLTPWVSLLEMYFLPVSFGVFVLTGLILWLVLRRSLIRLLRKNGFIDEKKAAKKQAKVKKQESQDVAKKGKSADQAIVSEGKERAQAEKKAQARINQRYYLHILSVLQRQGRLVDFFEEDLSLYDDAQIGAAVRSIQDNCKKTINKTLSPGPVLEKAEGEAVTVPADFDPSAIKLTGNVSGEPPFKGVLRHRGWRAAKLELPTLSQDQDPRIIAPAEVEIT